MRVYDTGFPFPIRTAIREAIAIELLAHAGLGKVASGYLVDVIGLPGLVVDLDDEKQIDLLWQQFRGRSPIAGVALGDVNGKSGGIGTAKIQGAMRVDVYVFSNHGRGFVEGRLAPDVTALASDTADPGLDAMLEETRMFLHRYQPELLVTPAPTILVPDPVPAPIGLAARTGLLTFEREWPVGMDETQSMWAITFSLAVQFDTNPKRAITGRITNMRQLHYLTTDTADPRNVILTADNNEPGGALTSITVEPDEIAAAVAGPVVPLVATGHYANGGTADLTAIATWEFNGDASPYFDTGPGQFDDPAGQTGTITATYGAIVGQTDVI